MYFFIFFAYLFSGVIGGYFLEGGAYTFTFDTHGYPTGVTTPYLVHCLVTLFSFYLSALLWSRIKFKKNERSYKGLGQQRKVLLSLLILFLLIWFFFGGIYVVLGLVDKTTFRISLGMFGVFFYIFIKSLIPVFCAYVTLLWIDSPSALLSKKSIYTFSCLFFASVIALGAGFKALSILIVMPSLIFLFWKINIKLILALSLLFCVLVITTFLFSKVEIDLIQAVTLILERATVLQGDVAWYLWGLSEDKLEQFSLFETTTGFLGGTILSSVVEGEIFTVYNYGPALTEFIGRDTSSGFSVVGSSFLNAFLMFGKDFYFIYSFMSGIVVSFFYFIMKASFLSRNYILAALIASYNVFFVFSWIGGGDFAKLFHVSTIFYLFFPTILIMYFIRKRIVWGRAKSKRVNNDFINN
ncbi:MAG: hypothetical protein ACJAS1_001367 [Oleiphilaceae bacterium]|jgi:hypothetical protein